ncbi:hypothetical protein M3182_01825 [Mesobacillus maritimus]|uniref:hypothetical protein n=1 Tax=Mesobacillus maritimus TaxID=1643336 RepID=UPI0020415B01|nr:hypothetical protein [Mesobacillus maritimus]MCM3584480.1 hypothetical protein [Mesobacillus maritimus]MCM3670787.1 hypothetical protein [Mesobacillus maritimus]
MLITKSYFLNEMERFKLEEYVLSMDKEKTEAEILKLDDRELTEMANFYCQQSSTQK